MSLSEQDLNFWITVCLNEQKQLVRTGNGDIRIPSVTLESIIRELQDARADLKRRELRWEDEFLQNNSMSDADAEDMFVGSINGVRYYKDGTKKEK